MINAFKARAVLALSAALLAPSAGKLATGQPAPRMPDLSQNFQDASRLAREKSKSLKTKRAERLIEKMEDHIIRANRMKLAVPANSLDVHIVEPSRIPARICTTRDRISRTKMSLCLGEDFLAYCLSDDELAFVIAHELAHLQLFHVQPEVYGAYRAPRDDGEEARSDMKAGLGYLKRTDQSKRKETDADKLGFVFAKTAGYDASAGAGAFFRRMQAQDSVLLGDKNVDLSAFSNDHPTDLARIKAMTRLSDSLNLPPAARPVHVLTEIQKLLSR